MTRRTLNRRHFLKLFGLGAAAATTAAAIDRAIADTPPDGPPRRLIVLSHCHGWPYRSWKMHPDGQDLQRPWRVDLNAVSESAFSAPLAPLFRHRNRMTVIDGVSLASAELDVDGNRHDTGWIHAWTGNNVDFGSASSAAQSASLDQLVASHIARPDRLPSIELNLSVGLESGRPISYAINGNRLPSIDDPAVLWRRLYGPAQMPDPITKQQRKVIDFAQGEYNALAPKLGAESRQKMGTHFDLLQRLSARIEGMANAMCQAPPMPATMETYNERFDAFSDLIASAFSCDLTRVVSFSLGEMPTRDFGWEQLTDDVHKGLAHDIYNDEDKHQAMTDYLTLHARQIARLVSTLESIPDVGGTSVMDNTLIVWGSELADGWHGYRHYCPVILGGAWHFPQGQYLYTPHTTPVELLVPASISPGGCSQFSGIPHQKLLVSVAQAMGLGVDHVGLKHLQGQTGEFIDCTGSIDFS